MSEPLKPRIDFSGPLDVEQNAAFKAQQMFNETEAQTFSPATTACSACRACFPAAISTAAVKSTVPRSSPLP